MAIFFLGLALRLSQLDADSLWVDEIATATWAQLDPRPIMSRTYADNLPLTYMVTRLGIVLLGDSDFALRLPPALLGSLSILLAYRVGELLWTRTEGLWGAFLIALSAYHVQYSQEVRHYALMLFLALLGLIFLLQALRQGRVALWIGFGLCTVLSLYNHYFSFLFLPAEVILAAWVIAEGWLAQRSEETHSAHVAEDRPSSPPARQGVMLLATLATVALLYLPRLSAIRGLASEQAGSQPLGVSMTTLQSSGRIMYQVFTAHTGAQGPVVLLWLALLLLGLAVCERKRIAFLLLWIGTPFVFLSIVQLEIFHLRYLVFILPVTLLVVGRGARFATDLLYSGLARIVGGQRWLMVLPCTFAVLLFGGLSVQPLRDYYAAQKPDWRSVASYMRESILPGDIILADGDRYKEGRDDYRVTLSLPFYLDRLGVPPTPVLAINSRLPKALLEDIPEDATQVWAVIYHADRLSGREAQDTATMATFHDISIVRLREPCGDTVKDTMSMLHVLLDLLPPQAHFDVHLALGGIYGRTGRCDEARAELATAEQVKPQSPVASQDLSEALAEVEQLCSKQHPLWRNLGDVITLLGYNVRDACVRPGASVAVTLWWRALDMTDRDYTVFIHLVGEDGRIWAQEDSLFLYRDRPTSTWVAGQEVTERYLLQTSHDTPPGKYTLKTGVYYWKTGERLPVWDEDGDRMLEDAILLGHITIE
jgi:hypothetical protein